MYELNGDIRGARMDERAGEVTGDGRDVEVRPKTLWSAPSFEVADIAEVTQNGLSHDSLDGNTFLS